MSNQKNPVADKVVIAPLGLLNAVAQYLAKQPYEQVHILLAELLALKAVDVVKQVPIEAEPAPAAVAEAINEESNDASA